MKKKFKNIPKKYQIITLIFVGITLIISALLMNSFSLPDHIDTVSFQSKSLNYENKEAGSFEVTKSTKWISKGKARVDINIDTISKIENEEKDIILVLDTSLGENLRTMKKTLLDFIEKTLSNENSKIALITYDQTSSIRTGFTKDKDLLNNRINTLTSGLGRRNYYQALVNIDSLLKEYEHENGRKLKTIFITNNYSNVDVENEKSYYKYLKEQYPYLSTNLIWYGESIDIEKRFGKISDKQTMTSISDLGITLLDTVDYTKEYDSFILSDVINTDYFDSNSISNVKSTNGIVRMEDDHLIWSLEEFHTGRSESLRFDISVKETPSDEIKMISTTRENIITYKLGELEEVTTNQSDVKLPTNYQIIYEDNKPSDCEIENFPSNEIKQVKEVAELPTNLKCNGYGFKGWTIITEGVESLSNNQFIMPESDVVVRAEWSKVTLEKSMDGTVLPGLPPAPVINSSKVGYPIITEYGIFINAEVSIDFSDRDDIDNYYSVDDGATWKKYEGPFNRLSSRTILAKSCLKDTEDDCIGTSKEIEMPEDALDPICYDGDDETRNRSFGSYMYLLVDESMQNNYVDFVAWIPLQEYRSPSIVFSFIDNNGELIGDSAVYSGLGMNYRDQFLIPEGTVKIEISLNSGSSRDGPAEAGLFEIRPFTGPKITETKYYPELTEYGVERGYNEVTIEYFQTTVTKLYRINDGEWQEYQDKKIRLEIGDTIEAKGVDEYGDGSIQSTYTAVLPDDALLPEAYDGDLETAIVSHSAYLIVAVDEKMIGRYLDFVGNMTFCEYRNAVLNFYFLNAAGEEIDSQGYGGTNYYQDQLLIPEGTVKIGMQFIEGRHRNGGTPVYLYEIRPFTAPKITETKYYPELTENKVLDAYNEVTIDYFQTSVTRLYRINNGEWQEYQDKIIRLEIGDVLEAKGINEYGTESLLTTHTAEMISDGLYPICYDGDDQTRNGSYGSFVYLSVAEEMQNRYADFIAWIPLQEYRNPSVVFYLYNSNGELIGNPLGYEKGGTYYRGQFLIPTGTTKIGIAFNSGSNRNGLAEAGLYEIRSYNRPVIMEAKQHATITSDGIVSPYNEVTIGFFNSIVGKLYRINNREWQNYQDKPIRLELGDTIEAKGIFESGEETTVASYTAVMANDSIGLEAYDHKEDTGIDFDAGLSKKINVSKEIWGKSYSLLMTTYANSSNKIHIKYLDKDGNVISENLITKNTTSSKQTYTIPENTVMIEFLYNSEDGNVQTIYEIDLDRPNPPVLNPNVNLSKLSGISKSKTIDIEYDSTCSTNYYKINSGEWQEYNGTLSNLYPGDKISAYCYNEITKTKSLTTSSYVDRIVMPATDVINVPIEFNHWGEKLYYNFPKYDAINLNLSFIDSEGNVLSSYNYDHAYDNDSTNDEITNNKSIANIIEIPEDAVNLKIEGENGISELGLVVTEEFDFDTDINKLAYDKDFDTYADGANKEIKIDSSNWGKYLYVDIDYPRWSNAKLYFKEKEGRILGQYSMANNRYSRIDPIPENTDYFEIAWESGEVNVYEIAIIDIKNPKEISYTKGPIIKVDESEMTAAKDIEIKYPVGSIGEYSLDFGQTWKQYQGIFRVDKPTTVFARIVDEDGNVISGSSFKITQINTDVSGSELSGFAKVIYKDNMLIVNAPTTTGSSNNVADQSGLYKSFKTDSGKATYYFRGNAENNYVTFAGKTWRIVRINEDGTVRLVLQESIDDISYPMNEATLDVGKLYYSNSFIKSSLEAWYLDNLKEYEDAIVEGKYFCEQAKTKAYPMYLSGDVTMTMYDKYMPDFRCKKDKNGYGTINNKISLLTYDEVVMAGGYVGIGNTDYYLQNNQNFWTMSAAGIESEQNPYVWMVGASGDIEPGYIADSYQLRPVINIKPDVVVSGKGTSTNPYVVEVETKEEIPEILEDKIKNQNPVIKKEPVLTAPSNIKATSSGLYSSTDTNSGEATYYFRGNVENNYVKFADKTWRIVRINEDGTIRLILQEGIENRDYRYNFMTSPDNKMYYKNSFAQITLNAWYANNLLPYEERIASGEYFCEQARTKWYDEALTGNALMTTYTGYQPTFKCGIDGNNYGIVNDKISTITYDEVVYAGGYFEIGNTDYYLQNDYNFWTMSPAGMDASENPHVWFVGSSGDLEPGYIESTYQIRPVINLKAGSIATGRGTSKNPYIVDVSQVSEPEKLTEKIRKYNSVIEKTPTLTTSSDNTLDVSGLYSSTDTDSGNATYYFRGKVENNYVTFADKTWRIVRINEDGTIRLILQDGIENKDYRFNTPVLDNNKMYYSNSLIKTPLETWYIDNLQPYEERIASGNYFCEEARTRWDDGALTGSASMTTYTEYTPTFKCKTDGHGYGNISDKISTITYDETVFAGGYFGISNIDYYLQNNTNFWTMSPAGLDGSENPHVWMIGAGGDLEPGYVAELYQARPVINLKADTIATGKGTLTNPYIVEVEKNEKEEPVGLTERIKTRNKVVEKEPILTDTSYNAGDVDGLYESTNTNSGKSTYYFRGNVENNYVSFAGQTWRIVRINEDGTVRLVLQEGIENKDYRLNELIFEKNRLYYSNSFVKNLLETWYLDNLKPYESAIAKGEYFCEQARVKADDTYTSGSAKMTTYTSYTPSFKCESDGNSYGILNDKIALLTYDEVWFAGAYPGVVNGEMYLRNEQNFWTMSTAGFDGDKNPRGWGVWSDGNSSDAYVSDNYQIRPVINLKSDIKVKGSGSSKNPYVVQVESTVDVPTALTERIKSGNSIVTQKPTLTGTSHNAGDISGLYETAETNSGNTSYYFRGNVENNYVTFAGKTWRIVRINEDGTVRLILQDGIESGDYYLNDLSNDKYRMYYSNSLVKPVLEAWYMDHLKSYENVIVEGEYFCEQAKTKAASDFTGGSVTMTVYNRYTPTLKCATDRNSYGTLNGKIGLINYDEVVLAGGYFGIANDDYYLQNEQNFWTMSTSGIDSSGNPQGWMVWSNGEIVSTYISEAYQLRPVINIKADVLSTGTGSIKNPYVVLASPEEETSGILAEKIRENSSLIMKTPAFTTASNMAANPAGLYVSSDTNSGNTSYYYRGKVEDNYLTFAGKTWRIVRINEDGTVRIVLQDSINDMDYPFNEATLDISKLYYSNSLIKSPLEAWYNDNLLEYEETIASGNYYCEQAKTKFVSEFTSGKATMTAYNKYSPTLKCESDGNDYGTINHKIGLITYDEVVMAGGYPEIGNAYYYLQNDQNFWTMSTAGIEAEQNPYAWFIGSGGDIEPGYVAEAYRVRPVINLKADTIVKGKGTVNNPYVVEVEAKEEQAEPLSDKVQKHNIIIEKEPVVTNANNMISTPAGLYSSTNTDSGNKTYYFRGNVENNYVTFAEQKWRIVRINEDGTIRLILEGTINEQDYPFNHGTADFNKMYYKNSYAKTVLNNWYTDYLVPYEEVIASGNYSCCEARARWDDGALTGNAEMTTYSSYQPTFKCKVDGNNYGNVEGKISAITYDEVVYAGGYFGIGNTDYYLQNDYNFWTISPAGMDAWENPYVWFVGLSGDLEPGYIEESYRLRPVINLKAESIATGKGTSTNPYVIDVKKQEENPEKLTEKIRKHNQVVEQEPTLTTSSNDTQDISGLYSSTSTNNGNATYYFRGKVENNYVSFADKIWRIVRINEDGTVRLILQEGIENRDYRFNTPILNNNKMYYSNSLIKTPLETWYMDNLRPYEKVIASKNYFCEEARTRWDDGALTGNASMTTYYEYTPTFKCETDGHGYGTIENKISTITYDEALFAGGYYGIGNTDYYLQNDYNFWTMSPAGLDGAENPYAWFIGSSGDLEPGYIAEYYQVRPVINLKEDVLVTGTGSIYNPYLVQVERNDEEEKKTFSETIKQRNPVVKQEPTLTDTSVNAEDMDGLYESKNTNSGQSTYYFRGRVENNYVTFGGFTWRIVRINEDGTVRLILQEGIEEKEYQFNMLTFDTKRLYYSNSFIKAPLETWYLDNLRPYESAIATGDYFCEQARIKVDDTYTSGNVEMTNYISYTPTFKCESDGNNYGIIHNKIGLLSYDEAWFAGAYPWVANGEMYLRNDQNFWTMSPAGFDGDNNPKGWGVWSDGNSSDAYVSDYYHLRPVINIKSDAFVTGSGSITNPYVVQVEREDTDIPSSLAERIKDRNPVVKQAPKLTGSSNNVGDLGGLYESKETNSGKSTYYFRGKVENNYVSFGGFTWRVVRINEDGTVRLILQEGINDKDYSFNNLSQDTYKLYYSSSFPKTSLQTWYTDNLLPYDKLIASGDHFCEQAKVKRWKDEYVRTAGNVTLTAYNEYNPNFKCETDKNRYGIINSKIALLSYDEAILAGGYPGYANGEYYLNNGQITWTISPAGIDEASAIVWTVWSNGDIVDAYVSDAYRVRPVINLKADVKASGSGSINNPYIVQVDYVQASNPVIQVRDKAVTISYPEGYINEYSLDLGTTWISYTEPLTGIEPTTVFARSVDISGNVVSSSSFKVTGTESSEISENSESPTEIPNINVSKVETGYKVDIIYGQGYTNEYSLDNGITWVPYTEAFIVEDNITILARSLDSNGNVVTSNSFVIAEEESSEISDLESESLTETPNIQVNDKQVDITYPSGYTNEYSLDFGETWNSYVESVTVEGPTTILARSVDTNKRVISSSSFKITR